MGRKAGVSAEQTRSELLSAAARVFALKGYDGASISDITAEAGLSSGAIYAHYASKAELFVAVVQEHGRQEFVDLIGMEQLSTITDLPSLVTDVADFFTVVGSSYDGRAPLDTTLLIETVAASKRHPEVSDLVSTWMTEGEAALTAAIAAAKESGTVGEDTSPEALSRFVTMVAMGARLTAALGLPAVDHDEWVSLIERLVGTVRSEPKPARRRRRGTDSA